MDASLHPRQSWRESLAVYRHKRVIAMLFLGFSAGLPFMLVFSTLSAWLRTEDVSRTAIGFFSWVGITYSIKFFWAPVVDRMKLPLLTRALGQRRSWMLLAMFGIGAGLLGMAGTDPTTNLAGLAAFALLVAFSSATQDVAIDAYRIEAVGRDLQGAMAATYQLGYRLAILAAGGGALVAAGTFPFATVYTALAALTLVGIVTVLVIREPEVTRDPDAVMREARVVAFMERNAHLPHRLRTAVGWTIGAIVCPFTDFFQRMGWLAPVILLFIGSFRMSDILMGVMANPFYLDTGFSLEEIGVIIKGFGTFMTIAGALLGGVLVARYGIMRPLLLGAVLLSLTTLMFAALAVVGADRVLLVAAISADNLSAGIAGTVFIAYLSSLTNTAYTATQYALFSSLMTLPGKLMAGFSGVVVDAVGYVQFFLYVAGAGLPAILLVLFLIRRMSADEATVIPDRS